MSDGKKEIERDALYKLTCMSLLQYHAVIHALSKHKCDVTELLIHGGGFKEQIRCYYLIYTLILSTCIFREDRKKRKRLELKSQQIDLPIVRETERMYRLKFEGR